MKLQSLLIGAAILSLSGSLAASDLTDYGVYRIDQAYTGYNNGARSMMGNGLGGITLPTSDSSDEKQLWVVVPNDDHTGYYFRNYVTGFYATSPIATSKQWYTVMRENLNDARSLLQVEERDLNGGDYLIYPASIVGTAAATNTSGYAHASGSATLVCWDREAGASGWRFTPVEKDADEVSARMQRWDLSPVERDKAYNVVNAKSARALTVDPSGALSMTSAVDPDDPAQLWVTVRSVSGPYFYLQNYKTGLFLTSPRVAGEAWSADYAMMPVASNMELTIDFPSNSDEGATIALATAAENGFLTLDASGNIVAGPASTESAVWNFNVVDGVSPEMIAEQAKSYCTYSDVVKDGHVYRILNAQYGHAMTSVQEGSLRGEAVEEGNASQLWLALANRDGNGFYFRSLPTGCNIYSNRTKSGAWTTKRVMKEDDNTALYLVPQNGHYGIVPVSAYGKSNDEYNYGFAHENGGANIVGWTITSVPTQWDFEEVALSDAEIAAYRSEWKEFAMEVTPGLYRLRNTDKNTMLTANPANNRTLGSAYNEEDEYQVWIVEPHAKGEGMVLRNFGTAQPLTNPRGQSQEWSLDSKYFPNTVSSDFYFEMNGNGFGISTLSTRDLGTGDNNYTFAHMAANNKLVCWNLASTASRWKFEPVRNFTMTQFEDKREELPIYQDFIKDSALEAIYSDAACTVLTERYRNMSLEDLEKDANFLAVIEDLRPMIRRAVRGDWSEVDSVTGMEWDDEHARKLRVQLYEPYSDAGDACNLTKTLPYTNCNNPTGLVADKDDKLYVFVDEEPQPGCDVYLTLLPPEEAINGHWTSQARRGTKLQKGMNVVTCTEDGSSVMIYYTVNVGNRKYKVSDFKDMKIHIEGASLNGYFNYLGDELYTPDTNEDWLYYRERARANMFFFLSEFATLDVVFTTTDQWTGIKDIYTPEKLAAGQYDFRAVCKEWDQICIEQRIVMGTMPNEIINREKAEGRDYFDELGHDGETRDDYADYFNNHILVITVPSAYMEATNYRIAFSPGIVQYILHQFPTGDLWGPAHEFGHINQGPINIIGNDERSNNVFSNIALYYRGTHTSRADYPSSHRNNFNNGRFFNDHGCWGGTRMYLQLWLYYHLAGRNKVFYPRLFEILRKDPLVAPSYPTDKEGSHYEMKDNILKFYKAACMAAQEDLTDFFESWGFFVPVHEKLMGDDTGRDRKRYAYVAQEDIDRYKAEVKQMAEENNWHKTQGIIFIDDRVRSEGRQSYGFDNTRCGEMGAIADYWNDVPATGDFSFTITDNTVTVKGGEGGVGFVIHDKEGRLIAFSNDRVFDVSAEAAKIISDGEAAFSVISGNDEAVTVVDAVRDGSMEQRLEALDVLLDKAAAILAKSDPDGRKAGYLKGELTQELREVYEEVKELRDNDGITTANSTALYNSLNEQFLAHASIPETLDNTVPIIPGGIYTFTSNYKLRGKGIMANAAGTQLANVAPENVDLEDQAQQWAFIPTDEENYYYIRNIKTGKYIGKAPANSNPVTLVAEPMKQLVTFRKLGFFSISPLGNNSESLHDDGYGRVTRWDGASDASQWSLTLIEDWESNAASSNLSAAIVNGQAAMTKAGTVTEEGGKVSATPLPEFTFLSAEMLEELYSLVKEGQALLEDAEADPEALNEMASRISEATDAVLKAMNRNVDRLKELVGLTRGLAEELGTLSEEISPITLSGDALYSNACHLASGGDMFTSWNVLLDNNVNTFFHSTYNRNSDDGLDHYIRIDLAEVISPEEDGYAPMVFTYTGRNNGDSNWFPSVATLEFSADGESWETLFDLANELPFVSAGKFESDPFALPVDARYLRFMVHQNRRSAGNAARNSNNGHDFFVLSEIGLGKDEVSCEPDTQLYPDSDEETLRNAVYQLHAAEKALKRPRFTNAQYDDAYDALLPHYDALFAIAQNRATQTGIGIISADGLDKDDVIFTLDGRRIGKICVPGIYVVNGRKCAVR